MRKGWSPPRFAVIALVLLGLAPGCEDATFDILPPRADAGVEQNGGDGGMTPDSGTGGTGHAGREGHEGEECGPNGCQNASARFCGVESRQCVACRLGKECPPSEHGCETDCGEYERCYVDLESGSVPQCAPDCRYQQPCPSSLPACDMGWGVCRECSPMPGSPYQCGKDRHCNFAWKCVACTKNEECDRSRPVCDWLSSQCRPCQNKNECNPNGVMPGAVGLICNDGLCEPPGSPPPQP